MLLTNAHWITFLTAFLQRSVADSSRPSTQDSAKTKCMKGEGEKKRSGPNKLYLELEAPLFYSYSQESKTAT